MNYKVKICASIMIVSLILNTVEYRTAKSVTYVGTGSSIVETKKTWASFSKPTYYVQRGKTVKLKLNNATSKVTWSSKNKKIATVKGGKVKGKKIGSTVITAKHSGRKITCKIVVMAKKYKLSGSNITLMKGKTKKISLKKLSKKKAKKIKWTSADKSVATVKKGKIRAKKPGITSITATYEKRQYKCTVFVDKNPGKTVKLKLKKKKKSQVTIKAGKTMTVGNIKKTGYKVTIPAGTLSAGTKVSVKSDGKGIDIKANGKDGIRLDNSVTVTLALSGKVSKSGTPYYMAVLKKNKKTYYIEPNHAMLRKGYLQFKTDHFSEYSLVKASKKGLKQIIKNKAYYAAAYKFTADKLDDYAGKTTEYSIKMMDKFLDKVADKIMKSGSRDNDTLKKYFKNSCFKDPEFFTILRGVASGDNKTTATGLADILVKHAGLATGKAYKMIRSGVFVVPDAVKYWYSGNTKMAAKTVVDAVSGELAVISGVQFANSIAVSARESLATYQMNQAVQGLLGTEEGRAAGYKGDVDITKDEEWQEFRDYQMKGAYRNYINDKIEKWRQMKQTGGDLTEEERAYEGALDYRSDKYSSSNFYNNPELEAERNQIKQEFDSELRAYLLKRVAAEKLIKEEADRIEEQTYAYINAGLFDDFDGIDMDEKNMNRLNELNAIKEDIEVMFDGSSPAVLEGYTGKIADSVNARRYADFVKMWLDAAKKAKDNTHSVGKKTVEDYLAKKYGVGIYIFPISRTLKINVGQSEQIFVLKGLNEENILSKCKISVFNSEVVKVDQYGYVYALSDGEGDIKIKYGEVSHIIHVVCGEGELELTPSEKTIHTGESFQLNFSGKWPAEFSSSKPKTASVTSTGKVTGVGGGKANIIATYHNRKYVCKVTVKVKTGLNKTSLSLRVGDKSILYLKGAAESKVTWGIKHGEKTGIVKVNNHGRVTALKKGKTVVVASYKGKAYKCKVVVKEKEKKKEVIDFSGKYKGKVTIYTYVDLTIAGTKDSAKTENSYTSETKSYDVIVDVSSNYYVTVTCSNEVFGTKSLQCALNGDKMAYNSGNDKITCDGEVFYWTRYLPSSSPYKGEDFTISAVKVK